MPESDNFHNRCIFNRIAKKRGLSGCCEECDPQTGMECPQVGVLPQHKTSTMDRMSLDEVELGSTAPRGGAVYPSYFEESGVQATTLSVMEVEAGVE